MDKILFFDSTNDGHHFIYNKTVMEKLVKSKNDFEVHYFSPLDDSKKLEELISLGINVYNPHLEIKKNRLGGLHLLLNLIKYANRNKINKIHFLYLDCLYINLIFLAPLLFQKYLTATLHWFPKRKSKSILLYLFLKLSIINRLVVHGEYTKKQVQILLNEKKDVNSICSIIYPKLHHESVNKEVYREIIEKLKCFNAPYLLAFGGLRHDKGIDILLQALSLLKDNLTLIIAGSEDTFTLKDINELINKCKINNKVFLDIKFISDVKLAAYFEIADIIVLPYRSYFSGQSGPLTEGAARSKFIIGPNIGEIGYTINHYRLGDVFEAENVENLADVISQSVRDLECNKKKIKVNQEEYKKHISLDQFKRKYEKFFSSKLDF